MRITLADVLATARESACPIIHISMLAGEVPFIASSPCLGNASVPLIDITIDDYLGLMAELRNVLVIEHDECLSFPIFTGGGRDPHAARVTAAHDVGITRTRLRSRRGLLLDG
jgi:hypothetical protein